MSQFWKTKRSIFPFQSSKYDTTEACLKDRPSFLQFLQKQTLKNHINKGLHINLRSKNKSTMRSNRPVQAQIGPTALGLKSSARNRKELQNEHTNHESEKGKIMHNMANGKENRPGSMNEIHYRPFSKNKNRFCNTQRYQSLRSALQERPYNVTEQMNAKKSFLKTNKYKVLKSQSRSHLSKFLHRQHKNLTESQEPHENQINNEGIFSKQRDNERERGQLHQINNFSAKQARQNMQNIQELINEKMKTTIQPEKQNVSVEQNKKSFKDQEPFDVDFSTIKLRNQSSSKFVSQDVIQELIQTTHHPIILEDLQVHYHKKRKTDIERVRRKFPQHFFK